MHITVRSWSVVSLFLHRRLSFIDHSFFALIDYRIEDFC